MLDSQLKSQLQGYLERITQPVEVVASLDDSDKSRPFGKQNWRCG